MAMAKIHKVNPNADAMTGWIKTFCGLEGMPERNCSTEFVNVHGFIFEATRDNKGVTCGRCRKGRWNRTEAPTYTKP